MKSGIAKIISIVLVVTLALPVSVSFGDNLESQLEKGQQQEKALSSQINSLQDELSSLKRQIKSAKKRIGVLKVQLKKQKNKLDKRQGELDARLRNMYKSGTLGFIDVILSSENVSDLLANLEMIKYIYSDDKKTVELLRDVFNDTRDKTKELKELKTALNQKKNSLSEKRSRLSAKKSKVSAKNKKLEAKIDAQNAASQGLLGIGSGGGTYRGGYFGWPTPGYYNITSYYGYRIHPILGYKKFHAGIDIGAPSGARVVAAASGTVALASWYGGLGNCVMINHGSGLQTIYGHNSSLSVRSGQYVKKGQTIARVGSTGNSTGPHCHFEVHKNGAIVNPLGYLK